MTPPNDMPADTELRTELHNLLDSFFEPNGGERYISDLELDIMQLIAARDEQRDATREKNSINIGDDVEYKGKVYEVVGLSTMKNNNDGEPEWMITHEIQEVAIVDRYGGVTYQKPAWLPIAELSTPTDQKEKE